MCDCVLSVVRGSSERWTNPHHTRIIWISGGYIYVCVNPIQIDQAQVQAPPVCFQKLLRALSDTGFADRHPIQRFAGANKALWKQGDVYMFVLFIKFHKKFYAEASTCRRTLHQRSAAQAQRSSASDDPARQPACATTTPCYFILIL